jgi:hypothetical protein
MKIEREELLATLRLLRPALAGKGQPSFCCIWFDGTTASAFNGIIGIQAPCKVPLDGGVKGLILLGMLESSSAVTAEIDVGETEAVLKLGAAKVKLPILPADQALLPFPEESGGTKVDAEFIEALSHGLTSIGSVGGVASAGVTVAPQKDRISFFSTDSRSLSWATTKLPKGFKAKRLVLSTLFAEQLLVLCPEGGSLLFSESEAVATSPESVRLIGALIEPERELDFPGMVATHLPKGAKAIPIPEETALALDRAIVLTPEGQIGKLEASISGAFSLDMKTDLGELHEAIPLKGHPKVTTTIDPALTKRGLAKCSHFLLTESAFVVTVEDGSRGFIAATVSKKG